MMNPIRFFVAGKPETKGSIKTFKHKHTGKQISLNQNPRAANAAKAIAHEAFAFRCNPPLTCPISIGIVFRCEPFKTKTRPIHEVHRWDLDKLTRNVLDALTGIIYADDSQVVAFHEPFKKEWSTDGKPGIFIEIKEAKHDP